MRGASDRDRESKSVCECARESEQECVCVREREGVRESSNLNGDAPSDEHEERAGRAVRLVCACVVCVRLESAECVSHCVCVRG